MSQNKCNKLWCVGNGKSNEASSKTRAGHIANNNSTADSSVVIRKPKLARGFGPALARAVCTVQQGYKQNSVPGGRFGSLHFLPLGSSYAWGWKHAVGSDLGDLDVILDLDKLSKYVCLFFLTALLAKLVGVFHLMSMGLTIILPSVKVWVKIFCLRWHCPACSLWWDLKPDWVEADLSMPMPYT